MDGTDGSVARAPRNFAARNARKADTRRKLVDCAIELIRTEGFSRLSVDSVTRKAGTNRTTFYLHFRNKTDLVEDIAEEVREDAEAAMAVLGTKQLTIAAVATWIDAVEALYTRHRELIEAMEAALSSSRQSAGLFEKIAGSYLRDLIGPGPAEEQAQRESRLLAAYLLVERFLFYREIRQYPLGGAAMRAELPRIVHDILEASPDR